MKISLERINEIHRADDENAKGHVMRPADMTHDIRLDGISFRYDPHSPSKTIDGVSLYIPEGKVTAIVGASGSGKTTLVKLMLGYYPVEAGQITAEGTDLAKTDLDWWRRQCGVVMQDLSLIHISEPTRPY